MKCNVVTIENKKAGSIDLAEGVFGVPVRRDILARMVNWQRAKRRAGNHNTKVVSEIRGTTAKPYRQKGTGRARQGSLSAINSGTAPGPPPPLIVRAMYCIPSCI